MTVSYRTPRLGAADPNHSAPSLGSCFGLMTPFVRLSPNYFICVETRHMKAALSAQLNKSDRNDARGIAHMMRVGLYRPVHVKTLASQKRRMLLTSRQLLQAKAIDIENDLRGTLRNFGLKVGPVGAVKFEARICELVADHPDLAAIAEPLLIARRVLREQLAV